MSRTFTSVDDKVLCEVISQARQRLVFIAPGIRPPVAEALAAAMATVPATSVHLVLDVDPEVCRMGYGDTDFKGMEILQKAAALNGLTVNHHPGIRIGLLIADETTLIYSPTPELIEAESRQPDKPNAIFLQNELPMQLADACAVGNDGFAKLQVGVARMDQKKVEESKQDLKARPPKEFNIARIERVFSSTLHYVEWKIENYKLTSRTLPLDAELFGVRDAEVVRRLTNRYHLFSKTDALTVEIPKFNDDGQPLPNDKREKFGPMSIDEQRARIKKLFIIEAGKFGTLIKRRDVPDFEKEIELLRLKIGEYKKGVQGLIDSRIKAITEELLKALLKRLQEAPPDRWRSRFLDKVPTEDDIKRLFNEDIKNEVKRVRSEFDPSISITYKDVTYQTFNDPEFRKLLERNFGNDAMKKLFSEYDAAPEKGHRKP